MCDKVHYLAETSSFDLEGSVFGQKGACRLWLIQLREIALKELKILKAVLQQRCPKTFFSSVSQLCHILRGPQPECERQGRLRLFPLNSFSVVY